MIPAPARKGQSHCRREAVFPRAKQMLLPRVVQPHSVALAGATEVSTAPASDISPSETGAFVIPFLPFDIVPLGLVALSDGHRDSERKPACPNQDGTNQYLYGAKS